MSVEMVTNYGVQAAQTMQVQSNVSSAKQGSKGTEQTNAEKTAESAGAQRQQVLEGERVQSTSQSGENQNQQSPEQEQEAEQERIRKAVSEINKKMSSNTEAVFGFHDETNRVTIKIVDKDSKEVVKELPPEKTLDMIAKVWELAGIMVDERR